MRTLYHWPLDPDSRMARLALAEKKIKVKLEAVNPWEPDAAFITLAPEGLPPVLIDVVDGEKAVLSTAQVIGEYAQDIQPTRYPLMPHTALARAEVRRLCQWASVKFMGDVNAYILTERLEKILSNGGAPDPATLRIGRDHLKFHLDYFSWLLEERDWMAGKNLSLADLCIGAHLSCLDYLNEIKWDDYSSLKEWYQKLKSRPSFRPLLADRIAGLVPPRHYADLDF